MRSRAVTVMRLRNQKPRSYLRRMTNSGCVSTLNNWPSWGTSWLFFGKYDYISKFLNDPCWLRLSVTEPNVLTKRLLLKKEKARQEHSDYAADKWYPPNWPHYWDLSAWNLLQQFDIEVRRVHRGCGRRVHTCAF